MIYFAKFWCNPVTVQLLKQSDFTIYVQNEYTYHNHHTYIEKKNSVRLLLHQLFSTILIILTGVHIVSYLYLI